MTSDEILAGLDVVQAIAQIGVFPLVYALWSLAKSIRDLKDFVSENYVRKEDLPLIVAGLTAGK